MEIIFLKKNVRNKYRERIKMKIELKYLVPALTILLFFAGIVNGTVAQPSVNQNIVIDTKVVNTIPNTVYDAVNSANNTRTTTWAKAYTTSNSSIAENVVQTSDGGYIVGANCYSSGCATLMKLDSNGIIKWQKKYSTALTVMQQTSDEGSIFAGQNAICKNLSHCTSIVKVDSGGNVQWENDLLYSSQLPSTIPQDIQQTSDGGYVVTGYAHGSTGNYSSWVAKLDSSGNIQWQKLFVNSNANGATAIRQTSDGGYAVAGYTLTNSVYYVLVFKLDSYGNLIWQRTYSTNYGGFATSLQLTLTSDGGYIVGGQVYALNYFPAILLKLDSKGNIQWAKIYAKTGAGTLINSLVQTVDGGYAFAGYIYNGENKAWIVKTDSNGNIQWQKTYGTTTASRIFYSINQTNDGGFVAAGATNQFNGDFDSWIVKVDPNGDIASCNDIQTPLVNASSVSVTVASGGLTASKNSFTYAPNPPTAFSGSFTPIKEC